MSTALDHYEIIIATDTTWIKDVRKTEMSALKLFERGKLRRRFRFATVTHVTIKANGMNRELIAKAGDIPSSNSA